ncbi:MULTISPECIES: ABC transporter ATP-binding protein [Porphyromonas]|uniref:ABC transporter ATP-binding protein n=1 Tax=Porphyromonas TaxID=836 RepID=UPI00051E0597|nr:MULTISPECIES: ABC transporter ATP-binding protein [Porphyromonas]KGL53077.1 antibiotic ABC transporter ATP-binding protein [Porphyromonas canoris]KGN69256.1 antibiotic ABC transporter ATP-binding protein [Porphyromonas sp. COT-108 OH1349]KGN95191.1 antibiotic ABC transporter ATP-binding protein [Porphyromonas sp. COT-108 OH2963]
MKKFIGLIKRFVPPYKWYLVMSILLNIISAILNLFTFALIMPILRILFKLDAGVYDMRSWSELSLGSMSGLKEGAEILKHNFNYYLTQMIETQGGSYTLIVLGVALVVMTALKVGTSYLAGYALLPIRTGVVRDIRNQLYRKMLSLPLSFFSEERKGDIIARVAGDVNEVEVSVMSSLDMLLKNPIMITIFLVGMIVISPQLTLFVFILLPIAGYIMGRIGKKLKRTSLLGQQQWGLLMSMVEEMLSGLRIIKAFRAEDKMDRRFGEFNNTFRRTSIRITRRQILAHPMSEFLGTATIAIVLWYGGTLILEGSDSLEAATFIYYLIIFYNLINPAKELSKGAYAVQRGMASLERIDSILNAENPIQDPATPEEITFDRSIKFDKVWFRYGQSWVLQDINLEIPKGKTIALVGESGSGKSTLVDLLPRFYDVTEGSIKIDGKDIRQLRVADLRSIMGNVNQEAILFNDTVFNNISFGVPNATQEEVERAAKIANAHEFISQMAEGYHTNIGDRGGKLSGGQRQRLSIARAVLQNPQLLILDEATSALDTASEKQVQEALENLMKGRTAVVIAHRLSTIVKADIICVLSEGKIVEQGTHQQLLALEGHYSRLCKMQQF